MKKKMNNKGFTLVEIMIVVAIIALLAAIAIPNLLRAKIAANESSAQGTLKTLSTACETYATANNGDYPADMAALTGADPAYMTTDPCTDGTSGYDYTCTMTTDGYTFVADPATDSTGKKQFTMTTGGNLTSADAVAAP